MVAEWGFFVKLKTANSQENSPSLRFHPSCFQSAWYLGLVLAGLSFILLQSDLLAIATSPQWSLIWFATPLALTAVAKYTELPHRQVASTFSSIAQFSSFYFNFRLDHLEICSWR